MSAAESTEEAMAILKETRKRLIVEARAVAYGMLISGKYSDGVTGGDVFYEMEQRGIRGLNDVSRHWVAAIFHGTQSFVPANSSQNNAGLGHVPLSRRWVLASGF